jgi:hypothetical protein
MTQLERTLENGMTMTAELDNARRGIALKIKKGEKVVSTVFVGQDEAVVLCESHSRGQMEKGKQPSQHVLIPV